MVNNLIATHLLSVTAEHFKGLFDVEVKRFRALRAGHIGQLDQGTCRNFHDGHIIDKQQIAQPIKVRRDAFARDQRVTAYETLWQTEARKGYQPRVKPRGTYTSGLLLTHSQGATLLLIDVRRIDHVEDVMIEVVKELHQLLLRHLAQLCFDI